jgi:hypothetical protein
MASSQTDPEGGAVGLPAEAASDEVDRVEDKQVGFGSVGLNRRADRPGRVGSQSAGEM